MRSLTTFLVLLTFNSAAAAAQRLVPSHEVAAPPRPAMREVARVNNVPLTSDRLDRAVSALIPMESFHRNVSGDTLAALRQKALGQLVDEELEYQDGVRRGITVSTVEVNAGVREASQRYGGRAAFENALGQTGQSLASARREIARTLTIRKTVGRVVIDKCQVSRAEAASFFSANPDRFVEPEQLHIYAITVGVNPSSTAEQWAAARSRAEDVRQQLAAGASFEEMARTYSTDASKTTGGDMGFIHRGSLSERFEQIAKDLPPGRVSDVVETLYGYHIVRVADIRPPERRTFAEVAAKLQKDLAATRCTDMSAAWVARIRSSAKIVITE